MNKMANITQSGIAAISKIDVFWNISATIFKVAAGVILLPFVLKFFPSETVGIWTIFITITTLITLLDFGFNPSFTRNVSYIFSGLEQLQSSGISQNSQQNQTVDYELLKGLIAAMRWFYRRGALILLTLSLTLGSYYIYYITKNYQGDKIEVYIAWIILCVLNTYNFYTLYYGALLQGKGLIKKSRQIVIIGRFAYLGLAILLIINGAGLIAVISAQLASVLIIRVLSHRAFFTRDIKTK
jgi:O-antigen/teichoic acid export membrane protein